MFYPFNTLTLIVVVTRAFAAALLVDCVFALGRFLAHLHHLNLQQGGGPLNGVFWTDRDQAADIWGAPDYTKRNGVKNARQSQTRNYK